MREGAEEKGVRKLKIDTIAPSALVNSNEVNILWCVTTYRRLTGDDDSTTIVQSTAHVCIPSFYIMEIIIHAIYVSRVVFLFSGEKIKY